MSKSKAVFLDRDGTINEEVGYLDSLEKLSLLPGAADAIRKLNEEKFKVIVVTNQSGVARGYFDEDFVRETHEAIQEKLRHGGASIDAFYYCPHHATEGRGEYLKACGCRKPEIGLLLQAAAEMNVDLARSYMVGDTLKDIRTGKNVPMKTVLVQTGHYQARRDGAPESLPVMPDRVALDLLDAVDWILKDGGD